MDEYEQMIGFDVEVTLTDGTQIVGRTLELVADIYGSAGGQVLVLADRDDIGSGPLLLAVPTALVESVTAD